MSSMVNRTPSSLSRRTVLGAAIATSAAGYVGTQAGPATAGVPRSATGPIWADRPVGFAGMSALGQDGTTGGAGGRTVTVSNRAELERYARAAEPYVIQVRGSITIEPFGSEIRVASNKTIIGLGATGEIVGGGFFLDHVHNVIIRNLTIRDSYLPGDWDGKDNDFDGIQVDTSHHIWIDHNHITRTGDGLVDLRLDSDYMTVSWNVFSDHNKAVGQGWTDNVISKLTMHHNWFRNVYQRNPSVDNTELAHLFNNYLQNLGMYGCMIRGSGRLLVENSYFESAFDPLVIYDGTPASLVHRGNVFVDSEGRRDQSGTVPEPTEYYTYAMDAAADVPAVVSAHAGPRKARGGPPAPRNVTVALDGSGDFASIGSALGAIAGRRGSATITIMPGTYREIVQVWPNQGNVTLRGATGDPADIVISYDLGVDQPRFYGGTLGHRSSPTFNVYGDDVTVEAVTIENAYADPDLPTAAIVTRTLGDRTTFRRSDLVGAEGTFLADGTGTDRRTYLDQCRLEGDVDIAFGPGTAVFDHCVVDIRGEREAGYVTAASTPAGREHGFLLADCEIVGGVPNSVYLGRPLTPETDAVAQVVVRDTHLGEQIMDSPWSDSDDLPWREARFFEYRNTGPGAGVNDDRPQLTDEQAAEYTVAAYLSGTDGWNPTSTNRSR